jgi:outer membrane protein assembly factor BamB
LEGGNTSKNQQCTIVAQNGILYVQTTQQNVFAVDGKTGTIKWQSRVGGHPSNMRGVAVAEGMAFTTSVDNFVDALERETAALSGKPSCSRKGRKVPISFANGTATRFLRD